MAEDAAVALEESALLSGQEDVVVRGDRQKRRRIAKMLFVVRAVSRYIVDEGMGVIGAFEGLGHEALDDRARSLVAHEQTTEREDAGQSGHPKKLPRRLLLHAELKIAAGGVVIAEARR